MTVRPNVDAGRLVNLAITVCIVLLVLSLLSMGTLFAPLVLGVALGAVVGWAVFMWRRSHGGTPFGATPDETLHLR